ncbi:MFS transporter [Novosphingobium aquae]|uniref:MFS transporter n=1 Tax=Novosphingobium aquae TaxID=3133435 RepID=A0ABU8SA39_9SPHN
MFKVRADWSAGSRSARIVALGIFLALFLKSVDKQLLPLFKPVLDAEFRWSDFQYAQLAASSQLVGAISLLAAGQIVDRLAVRWALALAVLVWSVLTFGLLFAGGIVAFCLLRLLLSATESIGNPAALRLCSVALPPVWRPAAIAGINLAACAGAIVGPVAVPALAAIWGWRGAAAIAGICGFGWFIWWAWATRGQHYSSAPVAAIRRESMPWTTDVWRLICAKALTDQLWWAALYWLPDFFATRFDADGLEWGGAISLCFAAAAIGSLTAPKALRIKGLLTGACYVVVMMILPMADQSRSLAWSVCFVAAALFAHQVVSTRIFLIICEDRFHAYTGTLASISAFAGHLLAFVTLQIVGILIGGPGGYAAAFSLVAIAHLAGTALLAEARRDRAGPK